MTKHYVGILVLLVIAGLVLFIYQLKQPDPANLEPTLKPASSEINPTVILPKDGLYTLPMFGYAQLNGRWSVQFVKVYEDSRCPIGVNCFWAGRAVIGVQLLDKNTDTTKAYTEKIEVGGKSVEMALKAGDGASIRVQITAKDLLPYPKAEQEQTPTYTAVLQIKQLPY